MRRNPKLALVELHGVDLSDSKYDDKLQAPTVEDNRRYVCNEPVLDYYRDLMHHDPAPVHKFRLMLVGDNAVGKTTLSRKLANESMPAPTSPTHGVETS